MSVTPASLFEPPQSGLRLPAEWEKQKAIWFTWPQNQTTWSPVRMEAEKAYREIIIQALRFQEVCLLVNTPTLRDELEQTFASIATVSGHALSILIRPTNDSWIRDYGALTVRAPRNATDTSSGKLISLDFRFNSWGGKYPPWDADDAVAQFMAEHRQREALSLDFVLEGGSIDTNGAGLLLTTRQCLLNKNRNPNLKQEQIERVLHQWLGADHILWLGSGIDGDDTDGHVDDLSRFASTHTILTAIEEDARDENYQALKANTVELERYAARLGFEIVEIPMPRKLHTAGLRVPATYLNFLILNDAVLVPVFLDRNDDKACSIFESHFPGRKIVPIDCRSLVFGQGAIHCSSMQEPLE